jgi:hypothetical protein
MATPKLKLGNDKWATKSKSLLAYNDEGNNFKSLPFQVERLSGGSYKGRNGLIQYAATEEPRIDFTNYSKGALLLEPQRTNLKTNSEAVNNWTQSNISTSTNQTTAPDGTNNADKIIENSGSGSHKVYEGVSTTSGQVYTWSVFLKSDTRSKVRLNIFGAYAEFDVTNQTLLTQSGITSYKIEDYGNGWGRFSITETANASSTLTYVYLLNDSGSVSYTGDGSSGLFVWGGQLEQGSYSTSYIPTAGSAATRVQDYIAKGGNNYIFNDSEGVLFAEIKALANDQTYRFITISDNSTSSNRVVISFNTVSNQIRCDLIVGGSTQSAFATNSYDITQKNKVAIKYELNNVKMFVNGLQVGATDTSANVFPSGTLSQINFDNGNLGSTFYYEGFLNDLQYFDTALTDAELQTLTTL